MARTIYLVACSAGKLEHGAPARDLYTSALFQKSRRLAELTGHEWYILSAAHHLVRPTQYLQPYNVTLKGMTRDGLEHWAGVTFQQLYNLGIGAGDRVVFLAGRDYRDHLRAMLEGFGVRCVVPLAGKGIGNQLAWLKRDIAARTKNKEVQPNARV